MDEFENMVMAGFQQFREEAAAAQATGDCVICKAPATFYSEAGRREYRISGTCEPCFDAMFPEEEDD